MEMISNDTQKKLNSITYSEHILSDEFQDKFYLKKRIKEIIPNLDDEVIYNAIDKCNKLIKPPRRKSEFLKAFLETITNL